MSDNSNKTTEQNNLPKRPKSHVIGYQGEQFVLFNLPPEWISRQVSYDYGLDLNVEIVKNNKVTGKSFSVQVKALGEVKGKEDIRVRLKSSTINYMKERFEPVVLV